MQVFAIFNVTSPAQIAAALQVEFPNEHLTLRDGEWLVATNHLTSREVCDRLQITGGENGNGIVVKMDAYWGRAANSIWEWVQTRKAASDGQ